MKYVHMLHDDLSRILMTFVYDGMNFLVDLLGHFFTVASGMCQVSSDKYFIALVPIGDQGL